MIPILQLNKDYYQIKHSGLFDARYYLSINPDVRRADINPLSHFVKVGWKEGRNPSAYFDISYYLQAYPDVMKAGVNPLIHYLKFGWLEGRNPSKCFDTNKYLGAYPDVHSMNKNPLTHFLRCGISQGLTNFPVDEIVESTQLQSTRQEKFNIDQYLSDLEKQAPIIAAITIANRKKINVVITTFNHEKFIEQCINSILMQKGNFNIEILVGDDCSIDNTKTILERYQEEFPQLIKTLPSTVNLGITRNLKRCFEACDGDYIAICEGDDYWIDQYKLQKQLDRLEMNRNLSMCFSEILLYYENTNEYVPHNEVIKLDKNQITSEDLIGYNYIGNFSCCMYRNSTIRKLPEALFDLYAVDWIINIVCGGIGEIGYLPEFMSVYRLHEAGAWTGRTQTEKLRELSTMIDVYDKFLDFRYHEQFSKNKDEICLEIARIQKS